MKKICFIIISIILLTSFFILPVNAAVPTISVESVSAAPGETVDINVAVNNNPGINSFSLGFSYDMSKMSLQEVAISQGLGGQFTYAKKAVWLNNSDSNYNGIILTLTFNIANDAQGTTEVTVTYDEGEIINRNEDDVNFAIAPGTITIQPAECSHKWDAGKVTKVATCKEEGIKTFTCDLCKSTKTEPIPKTAEHQWDEGKLTTPATTTAKGEKTYTCIVCGKTKTEPIPILSSDQPTITVAEVTANAGSQVNLNVSIANNPGINSFSLGFSYDETKISLKEVAIAPDMGGQFTYTKKAVWLNNSDSNFNGNILTLTFDIIDDAQGVSAVTVTYDEGEIINRNEEDVNFIIVPGKIAIEQAECSHKWDKGKVTKAATCAAEGVMTFTCTVCKMTKTNPITKTTDHKWDDGKITKQATEKAEGIKTFTCSICGTTKTEPILKLVPVKPDYMPGDVDGDGEITSGDARLALRRSVRLEDYPVGSAQYLACDADGNSLVEAADARLILRASVGLEDAGKFGKHP